MKTRKQFIQQMIDEMIYLAVNMDTYYELINVGYSDLAWLCTDMCNSWQEVYRILKYILNDGVPNENMSIEESIKYIKNVVIKVREEINNETTN